MLTAYQIDALRDKATTLLDPVINFLIEDIAERVSEAGQLTGTAAYQVWRAQRLGMSQKKLKKEIAKRLKIPLAQVEQLMRQAAKTGYNFDLSRLHNKRGTPFEANSEVQQIVDEAVDLAQQNLTNIVQTMGFVNGAGQAQPLTRAYQQACDQAFMKSVTGATDYISAVRNATRGLAAQGIVSIDYASGVHTSIEAAVRRNIMGGLGLMQEQISEHNHDALGCDGWEISAHMGSAPDHEPYQGRQYDDKTYTNLNNSLLRRIGTLNCGHAASPIILGVNEPQYTPQELEQMRQENDAGVTFDGKHYTLYEATQRQRKIERSIRNQKRKILIDEKLGDQGKLETDQIRLTLLRQEYARFSKAAGLRTQHERAEVAGFTWEKGKAAEQAAASKRKPTHSNSTERESQYGIVYGAESINVDWRYIDSEEYRAKFSGITDSPEANERILETVKTILRHRDSTEFEDLYLLGMDGKTISAVTDSAVPHGVCYTEEFREALHRSKESRIPTIAIHNHPHGYPPSADDFKKAFDNQYEIGIAIGHNGQVYVYRNPNIELSEQEVIQMSNDIDFMYRLGRDIDNASQLVYDGYGLQYIIMEGGM